MAERGAVYKIIETLNVKVKTDDLKLIPVYASLKSSGADLRSNEEFELEPGHRKIVSTGIVLEIPCGYEGQVRPRSGLAAQRGITILNTPGTIDSDYRGEIKVIMFNTGQEILIVHKYDRIAQLVICPIIQAAFFISDVIGGTERGSGGLGSTGIN